MTDKRWRRIVTRAVAIAATASLCSCANWQGLNSLPMPGTEGSGPGWFEVQAQMPDVNTIQPNTRVRLGDVDVGDHAAAAADDVVVVVTDPVLVAGR